MTTELALVLHRPELVARDVMQGGLVVLFEIRSGLFADCGGYTVVGTLFAFVVVAVLLLLQRSLPFPMFNVLPRHKRLAVLEKRSLVATITNIFVKSSMV